MTELQKYQRVNACETIEDLQQCILDFADKRGMIHGRGQPFDAKQMAEGARLFYDDKTWPNVLTRRWGLRQQAMYLKYHK